MNELEIRIKNLSDLELKQAFEEFVEYNRKGVLGLNTLIRKIRNEYAKDSSWDLGCMVTSNEIMFEIAKRHYESAI